MKRCLDLIISLLGLLFLVPLFILMAILIRTREGHPVFFRQHRVGRSGKPFLIWKFRTMKVGKQGSLITVSGDSRITLTGKIFRKWKLDELPQLLNVVSGTMSLVGPRPEISEFVDLENPEWQEILTIRPGITDWATLRNFDEEQVLVTATDPEHHYKNHILPSKMKISLHYVRNRSLREDLRILWLTTLSLAQLAISDWPRHIKQSR